MADDSETPGSGTPGNGTPASGTPGSGTPGNGAALIAEAMAKSGLLWIEVPGDRAWPAWHVWLDGTAYVVSGPGEQPLPWLPQEVTLTLRSKDTGGRLLRVPARAEVITPADGRWEAATAALKAGRLNGVGDLVARWVQEATVTALTPQGALLEGPGAYAATSGAAPPPPTQATTRTWHPWHLRGRPQRRWSRRRK